MTSTLYQCLLWTITIIFLGRILAQIFVGIYSPGYLPKMEMWYSGLLPYPILLTYQMFLYTCMVIFNFCLFIGKGPLFFFLNDKVSIYYIYFGVTYFSLWLFVLYSTKLKNLG